MSLSCLFILRPVGTSLLALGLLFLGILAYANLPVASLPDIEPRFLTVEAALPGASSETMAAIVAAPLERRLGAISGVSSVRSTSQTGFTTITMAFGHGRSLDAAAIDAQEAINATQAELPATLTQRPTIRKARASAAPLMIMAMTSRTRPEQNLYDMAELVVATAVSRISGVGRVSVFGSQRPAIRIAVDPAKLKSLGLGLEDVRLAIAQANVLAPAGILDGSVKSIAILTNSELFTPAGYRDIILKSWNGGLVRLEDVASVEAGPSDKLSRACVDGQPAAGIIIQKSPGANAVETAERIKSVLPELERLLPADVALSILTDRTATIRGGLAHIELTLAIGTVLTMAAVFFFLGSPALTLAAGVAVPLSIAGALALLWAFGHSLNSFSLLALTTSTGFIADDAIVVMESCFQGVERGFEPRVAALEGVRRVEWLILAMTLTLAAAFLPLLFLRGEGGALLAEYAWVSIATGAVSAIVSLTVIPTILACVMAQPNKHSAGKREPYEKFYRSVIGVYEIALRSVLRHRKLTLAAAAMLGILTIELYVLLPKGPLPAGETDFLIGVAQVAPGASFEHLAALHRRIGNELASVQDVKSVAATFGGTDGSSNSIRFYISLRPASERQGSTAEVLGGLRAAAGGIDEADIYFSALPEIEFGQIGEPVANALILQARQAGELEAWLPRVKEALAGIPGILAEHASRQAAASELRIAVDRVKAAKFGVAMLDVDRALGDAFSQRPISTIYSAREQYYVILETKADAAAPLETLFVKGTGGRPVPILAIGEPLWLKAPLAIDHIGLFPAVAIGVDLAEGMTPSRFQSEASRLRVQLGLPESVVLEPPGNGSQDLGASQGLVMLSAAIAVYLVLGILYESLLSPLIVLSVLPSASTGAFVATQAAGLDLSVMSMMGIVSLIAVVKKNSILLVDFANEQRVRGLDAIASIESACRARFRPIVMTNLIAVLGALPLVFAFGAGSELLIPLGLTMMGGLAVSLIFTLLVTPVICLEAFQIGGE